MGISVNDLRDQLVEINCKVIVSWWDTEEHVVFENSFGLDDSDEDWCEWRINCMFAWDDVLHIVLEKPE